MNHIVPFKTDDFAIRVIELDGEPWFVGKDIAEALGYSDTEAMTRRLDDDEKQNRQIVGFGNRGIALISEAGLYAAVLGSTKEEAKTFKKWVTAEVLPSIRKTGGYQLKRRAAPDEFARALKLMPLAVKAALATGCNPNAAIIHANQAIRKETSKDVLALLERTHLEAENQESLHYCPTELGEFIGLTARQVNQALFAAGLQIKPGKHWIPTKEGMPYAFIADVGKAHGSGASIQQTRWYESVLPFIQDLLNPPRSNQA